MTGREVKRDIQRQTRQTPDGWHLEEFTSLNDKIWLARSEAITVREIYDRILV
jgi:hypothetical protein